MLRALLFCLALGLALAPGAGAEVRVIDTTTGASRTILRDDPREPYTEEPHLIRFADPGTVLVRKRGRVLAIRIADGSVRRLPWLDEAEAIGPGGRSVHLDYGETDPWVILRGPAGQTVGRYDYGASYESRPWRGRPTAGVSRSPERPR